MSNHLPPDDELKALALVANKQLQPNAGVSFFRIKIADGERTETGIVFECGVLRAVVKTLHQLSINDTDEIVKSVQQWANRVGGPSSKWTTDPTAAA